jgi:hypothetical protein
MVRTRARPASGHDPPPAHAAARERPVGQHPRPVRRTCIRAPRRRWQTILRHPATRPARRRTTKPPQNGKARATTSPRPASTRPSTPPPPEPPDAAPSGRGPVPGLPRTRGSRRTAWRRCSQGILRTTPCAQTPSRHCHPDPALPPAQPVGSHPQSRRYSTPDAPLLPIRRQTRPCCLFDARRALAAYLHNPAINTPLQGTSVPGEKI